ncbi:hypothetical protein Ait01nite_097180 [Actinoplanes italicus]|uniref:Pyridine nucleotide-disulfide oxidoreductase n=2 Tax=Actinoplanes TaxID=1865 RepID=A0A2T0JLH1_9ACTN|nr:pyridine nucleotide-disulfide oxidoreductase [Actinoplanes italicus]GIE36673.1 hypothetical protein Ait01nite_097180 [Actinoplanes italicus]
MESIRDLIIIGSGPSGYTAALYAARANLNPLVIEGVNSGGALMTTTEVENFPGHRDGIMGPELMDNMRAQAEKFGAEFLTDDVTRVELTDKPTEAGTEGLKTVWVGDQQFFARAVILATGSAWRPIGVSISVAGTSSRRRFRAPPPPCASRCRTTTITPSVTVNPTRSPGAQPSAAVTVRSPIRPPADWSDTLRRPRPASTPEAVLATASPAAAPVDPATSAGAGGPPGPPPTAAAPAVVGTALTTATTRPSDCATRGAAGSPGLRVANMPQPGIPSRSLTIVPKM